MSALPPTFAAHVATGATTICRAWAIFRVDGTVLGFTDHDCTLDFDGIAFKADTGLTAMALQQSTGLSVDNTDAIGALSDDAFRAEDIEAGRFDGAEVKAWLVNWQDPSVRWLQFRGTIGEIRRTDTAFEAELRGLTQALNRKLGRVFQKPCTAVLGDAACGVDLDLPGLSDIRPAEVVEDGRVFRWTTFPAPEQGWFSRGKLSVTSGPATGLSGLIKEDKINGASRTVTLWEPLRAAVSPGDTIRLDTGCDKRMETCRTKFANLANFRGFPDLPGEDWVAAVPRSGPGNTGGSRRG
ncbi:DUF2163 domain-containing protein [Chachezhania sediminis]|uniref:DUF2163 domain-containing protein n=1 Tax=Chachezhania sediminis TaxID=2599291 RepID=UPI00131BA208|nr:DUF2163 domain-containing protein [Chachezhania sediminis]